MIVREHPPSWSRCSTCGSPLAAGETIECGTCIQTFCDSLIRDRIEALSPEEALSLARVVALRDGEKELARVIHRVLTLHLMGALGELEPVLSGVALVVEHLKAETGEGVN